MPTMLDASTRATLVGRLRRLRPDAKRRWGRMTAPQMASHLDREMRHLLGELRVAMLRSGAQRHPLVQWFAIDVMPWPKMSLGRTAPELLVLVPGEWDEEVTQLEERLERWVAQDPGAVVPEHPSFGKMSRARMGRYLYKHWDHHLAQFES